MFVLCHQNKDGSEVYYTGRAGAGWIGSDINEAFVFFTKEVAVAKMSFYNDYNKLHGLWFHVKELNNA